MRSHIKTKKYPQILSYPVKSIQIRDRTSAVFVVSYVSVGRLLWPMTDHDRISAICATVFERRQAGEHPVLLRGRLRKRRHRGCRWSSGRQAPLESARDRAKTMSPTAATHCALTATAIVWCAAEPRWSAFRWISTGAGSYFCNRPSCGAGDQAGLVRAFQSMVGAGMDLAKAAGLAGLMEVKI